MELAVREGRFVEVAEVNPKPFTSNPTSLTRDRKTKQNRAVHVPRPIFSGQT
jgi:hypothetical protein